MYILGISAFERNSAACLVKAGKVVAAIQEDCFTRKKNDKNFPVHAIHYCLAEAKIEAKDVSLVAFYEEPIKKANLLREIFWQKKTIVNLWNWFKYSWMYKHLKRNLNELFGFMNVPLLYVEQQVANAAAAFYTSPYQNAAIMVLDDSGCNVEWLGMGIDNKLEVLQHQDYPHSLGLFFSFFADFLCLNPFLEADKMLEMAASGRPIYKDKILEKLFIFKDQGCFELELEFSQKISNFNSAKKYIQKKLKITSLKKGEPMSQVYLDLAASVQAVLEEIIFQKSIYLFEHYQLEALCLGGEVARNYIANQFLLQKSPFQKVWVQPNPGKAGGALGAALYAWYYFNDKERHLAESFSGVADYGPAFSEDEISGFLNENKIIYHKFDSEQSCFKAIAGYLEAGYVIGWFSGRMEFDQDALSSRSILVDPEKINFSNLIQKQNKNICSKIGIYSGLKDSLKKYFEELSFDGDKFPMQFKKRKLQGMEGNGFGVFSRVFPIDGNSEKLSSLLSFYKEKTGKDLLVTLPFKTVNSPIACTPRDAFNILLKSDLDYLLLENFLVGKNGG